MRHSATAVDDAAAATAVDDAAADDDDALPPSHVSSNHCKCALCLLLCSSPLSLCSLLPLTSMQLFHSHIFIKAICHGSK
jgi:hypothetical protein